MSPESRPSNASRWSAHGKRRTKRRRPWNGAPAMVADRDRRTTTANAGTSLIESAVATR